MFQATSSKIKSEKREEKRRKSRSHKVSGAGIKKLARLIEEKGKTTMTKPQ